MIQVDPIENKLLVIDEGGGSLFDSSNSEKRKEKIELIAKFYKISKENIYSDRDSLNGCFERKELEIPDRRDGLTQFRHFIEYYDSKKFSYDLSNLYDVFERLKF